MKLFFSHIHFAVLLLYKITWDGNQTIKMGLKCDFEL